MTTVCSRIVWTVGLLGVSVVALAGEPQPATPSEPVGFITGGVIGGLAAGPVGAVIGAGIGTWLGNRVHRAGEAARAEARAGALTADRSQLEAENARLRTEKTALAVEKGALSEADRALTARLDQVSQSLLAAHNSEGEQAPYESAKVLDGLQGDVLFRTGSAQIAPDMAHGIEVLAEVVAKSPDLKVRVEGYADPRGREDANLKLSQARADAVRAVFLQAGVSEAALEINAYGQSQSVAQDPDGFALERRVRLTLKANTDDVAQLRENQ